MAFSPPKWPKRSRRELVPRSKSDEVLKILSDGSLRASDSEIVVVLEKGSDPRDENVVLESNSNRQTHVSVHSCYTTTATEDD